MMETKTAAVSMRNVTKTFGSVIANEKVSLDINKGEILSNIIGSEGVIKPNFSKEIWIGNYYVSIKVH